MSKDKQSKKREARQRKKERQRELLDTGRKAQEVELAARTEAANAARQAQTAVEKSDELERRIAELLVERADLRKQLDQAGQDKAVVVEKYNMLMDQWSQLKSELSETKGKLTTAEAKITEMTAEERDLGKLRRRVKESGEEIKDLHTRICQLEAALRGQKANSGISFDRSAA